MLTYRSSRATSSLSTHLPTFRRDNGRPAVEFICRVSADRGDEIDLIRGRVVQVQRKEQTRIELVLPLLGQGCSDESTDLKHVPERPR